MITKMLKMSVLSPRSETDRLLHELMLLGCVELRETDADNPSFERSIHDTADINTEIALIARAMETLRTLYPEKTPFLSPAPELTSSRLFDEKAYIDAVATARSIENDAARIRRIETDTMREYAAIEALNPWINLTSALDVDGTELCSVLLGSFSSSVDTMKLERELEDRIPECEMITVSESDDARFVEFIYLSKRESELTEILREYPFTQSAPKNVRDTAKSAIAQSRAVIARLTDEQNAIRESMSKYSGVSRDLKIALDFANTMLAKSDAAAKLSHSESVTYFSGWVPEDKQDEISRLFDDRGCAYEFSPPEETEYPEVPILLKNNSVTSPLSMVTEMYSLPAYDGIDPNPLIAPFFIIIYGLMMADIGYGILMVILSLIIKHKKKPRGGFAHFTGLLFMCGIATIGGGFITGGLFGDAPAQIAGLFGSSFSLKLPWPTIDPMVQPVQVMIGAFALGFVQIITGMAINLYMAFRDGHWIDGILDNVPWWITFAGIGLGALGITWVAAIIGLVLIVATAGRSKPTIAGKIISGFGKLYDITSYFTDVLSYARVMALMLAGGVIANVFNMIAAMTGNIFTFTIIFLIGHALNIALNLLGNYVHDLRLQCLEYFGKFYKDGGRKFEPLTIKSRFFVVK